MSERKGPFHAHPYRLTMVEPLRSHRVDKDLVKTIEDCVLRKIQEFEKRSAEEARDYFTVVIEQPCWKEQRRSIEELVKSGVFPDDIGLVQLSYFYCDGVTHNEIEVAFGLLEGNCKISMVFSSPDAREFVEDLRARIKAILEKHKTINHIFHLAPLVTAIVGVVVLASAIVTLVFGHYAVGSQAVAVALAIIVWSWIPVYNCLRWLLPYTEFNTKQNAERKTWAGKIVWLLVTYLVFSPIAGLLLVFVKRWLGLE